MKRVATFALLACGLAQAQTWDFDVRLDDKPVGSHRFTVSGPPAAREVHSVARMDVKLVGFTVFRYRHDSRERWRGDCLAELQSTTDDDGKPLKVAQTRTDGDDCLMSFAYWNPALPTQARLLNPQTGLVEQVRFERLPDATLAVRGREVQATRWRLTATPPSGSKQNLVLWLGRGDASWLGLDAHVKGDRLLTYRLK